MSIKHDYILDMIQRFVTIAIQADQELKEGQVSGATECLAEVIGLAYDMDADVLLELSPESLATMTMISAIDEQLAHYAAYCMIRLADLAEGSDPVCAGLRREQAAAVADLYNFDPASVPPELEAEKTRQLGL